MAHVNNSTKPMRVFIKTVEQGAAKNVWCATSHQLDGLGGVYCEDCDVAPEVPADPAGPQSRLLPNFADRPNCGRPSV